MTAAPGGSRLPATGVFYRMDFSWDFPLLRVLANLNTHSGNA